MINEKYQMTLDDTLVLRGMSILIIILHNYIHRFSNVLLENQHVYYPERNKELINSFFEFDSGLFLDLISHYGHYGVPVFVFLSGYGLVMKYEKKEVSLKFQEFMKRHAGKLWLLLLPLLIPHFLFLGIKDPSYFQEHWFDLVLMAGFAGNLHPEPYIFHGPWWFFSLIVQLYIIYYAFVYHRNIRPLVLLTVACIMVQATAIGVIRNTDLLEYFRFNFIGSVLPFALGIIAARRHFFPTGSMAAVAFILFIVCCFNQYLWLLTFGLVTIAVLPLARALHSNNKLYAALKWLGGISAFLFVTHPIVRSCMLGIKQDFPCLSILGYTFLSILFAWEYKRFLVWCKNRIVFKQRE